MQLVTAGGDPGRAVHAISADGFKLADDGGAIGGDGGADPGDHGIVAGQAFAVIMHFGAECVDRHVAAGGVDHLDGMAAFFALFDEASGGVVVLAAEHGDAQGAFRGVLAHGGGMVDIVA